MKHSKQHANATTIQGASIRASPRQLDELARQLRRVAVVELFADEDLTFSTGSHAEPWKENTMDPDPHMEAAPKNLGRNLDREEEAVADAMIERFGPEAVDLIVAAKEGLNRAAQLYEDLESLAAEVSAKHQQSEFSQALEQIDFWNWGLSGVEDSVRSRLARGSQRGAEQSS